jgi:SAM-dependent methyltransferase
VFLATGDDTWRKVGVELTEEATRYARTKFGLTVHQGLLEAAPLTPKSFDAITMWDVVEHLHTPRRTLTLIRHLLRDDGVFVFRVPNLDAWDARLFGRYWAGLDQPRHLFVPDETTITRLLAETGFVEVERQCLSGTYGVLVLSWRFWLGEQITNERWRRRAQRLVENFATRLLLAPLLWLVDKGAKKGSLLTIVARPKSA